VGAHGKIMLLSFTEDEGNIYKRILEVINNCKSFEWCNISQNIEVIHAGALEIDLMERCVSVDSVEVKTILAGYSVKSKYMILSGRSHIPVIIILL